MSLSIPYGELEQKFENAKAAIERVRELHFDEPISDYISHASNCTDSSWCEEMDCEYYEGPWCHKCEEKYPCTELQILEGKNEYTE